MASVSEGLIPVVSCGLPAMLSLVTERIRAYDNFPDQERQHAGNACILTND